ncbi:sel1 repeat family protein [Acidithiobacillus ferridurans]|nr:sel1 repeat family protein [Acidithiobacillus ferridurans]
MRISATPRLRPIVQLLAGVLLASSLSACSTTTHKKITTNKEAMHLEKEASHGNAASLHTLRQQANTGNIYAEVGLSEYYWDNTFENNYNSMHKYLTAYKFWTRKAIENAVEHGNASMENRFGSSYYSGIGEPQDTKTAMKLWKKAAALGYAKAENNLGNAYYYGIFGVPKNYAKAAHWYEIAAAQDNIKAETNLGRAYVKGYGVQQNYAKAIYWFKKAAAHGYSRAEYHLGNAYYSGHGVPQNTMTAIKWWKMAAAQRGFAGVKAQHKIDIIGNS